MNPRRFVCSRSCAGEQRRIVWVHATAFDAEWRKDAELWIPSLPPTAGWRRAIWFDDWQEPFEVSIVYVGDYAQYGNPSNIAFEDGRHRFRMLYDLGFDPIPVGMDKESFESFPAQTERRTK